MIRELLDIALLEDFVGGLARATGLRVAVYDSSGALITASPPGNAFVRLIESLPETLPPSLALTPLSTSEPPVRIGFIESRGVWYVIAPVHIIGKQGGYIAVGEFRAESPAADAFEPLAGVHNVNSARLKNAWATLSELERSGEARPVIITRWASRMLADRCERESRVHATTQELALVGDIAELLTGERDLQTILNQIMADTARVMNCRKCSLRLYNPVTDELVMKAGYNLSPRYLNKGPVARSESPVDEEALRGHVVYIEDARRDARVQYPDEIAREGIISVLTAGLMYRGTPIGVIRVYTDHRHRFRPVHHNLLRAVASQAATAIVHAQMLAERLRSAETERQLALAGDVQDRMIRTPPPKHPGLDVAFIFQPSSHVGGDFCDFFTLADGRLAAVVADVAGKGVPASLTMASVRGALRATAECHSDLGEIVSRLNRHVCRETLPSEFVTLLLVAIDRAGRRLTYCNAGHEPLLLLRDGQLQALGDAGLVLGIDPQEQYHQAALALQPNDFLLLFTDGAVDAMNFQGQPLGRDRFYQLVREYGGLAPEPALANIRWDIRRFVGLAEQSDDLTLVALRVAGAATA